jgi:putative phosphoesterase
MRVGVISDTHIPEAGPALPAVIHDAFRGCDMILHCGDLHHIDVIDDLARISPTLAARGNGDTYFPIDGRPGVPEDERIAMVRVIEIEGFRVGLTHDLEMVEGRPEEFAESYLLGCFGERVDIALCGHTHVPMAWGLASGVAILNPGSPMLPFGYTHTLGTVGLLDIQPGRFEYTVIDLPTGRIDLILRGPGAMPLVRGPRPERPPTASNRQKA